MYKETHILYRRHFMKHRSVFVLEFSLLMNPFFVRTWYKKVRLLFNHLPTSINPLLMHHKEEQTTLAYLRQTRCYTRYPLDSPRSQPQRKRLHTF